MRLAYLEDRDPQELPGCLEITASPATQEQEAFQVLKGHQGLWERKGRKVTEAGGGRCLRSGGRGRYFSNDVRDQKFIVHYRTAGEMGDKGSRGPTVRGPKGQPGPPGLPGEWFGCDHF